MKQMILFFSHTLTSTQKEEAKKNLNVDAFTILPEELQKRWSQIEPFKDQIEMQPFYDFLLQTAKDGDIVLVQGDYGATYSLVEFSKKKHLIPVYATAVRGDSMANADDFSLNSGEFKHCRFRIYK